MLSIVQRTAQNVLQFRVKREPVVAGLTAAVALTLVVGIIVSSVEKKRADVKAAEALAQKEYAEKELRRNEFVF